MRALQQAAPTDAAGDVGTSGPEAAGSGLLVAQERQAGGSWEDEEEWVSAGGSKRSERSRALVNYMPAACLDLLAQGQ